MKFTLIDRVLERTETRLVALKHVSAAEEYLQDHFPTFPVLPGVMMVEAMTQAARALVDPSNASPTPLVLCEVRALKYGQFVKPGDSMRVEVDLAESDDEGGFRFKGRCLAIPAGSADEPRIACTGRLALRPARLERPIVAGGPADE